MIISDDFDGYTEAQILPAPWQPGSGTSAWRAYGTTAGTVGNPTTGTSNMRHSTALDSAEHYCQALWAVGDSETNRNLGVAVRFSPSALTMYAVEISSLNDTIAIRRVVAGVENVNLTGNQSLGAEGGPGGLIRLEVEGDGPVELRAYYRGVLKASFSDTHANRITGNQHVGLRGFNLGSATGGETSSAFAIIRWDNFEAGDLGQGPDRRSTTIDMAARRTRVWA
jgi:hypothetical protein